MPTALEVLQKLDSLTGGNLTRQTQGINFWLSEEELQLIADEVSIAPTCDMTAVSVDLTTYTAGGDGQVRGSDPGGLLP
jgi:hypothetical protein